LPFRALLSHARILLTTRYVHPAPAQQHVTMENCEKFRGEAMISAAAAQRSQAVTTKVTAVEPVATPSEEIRKKGEAHSRV
jgi:hypothetical protein